MYRVNWKCANTFVQSVGRRNWTNGMQYMEEVFGIVLDRVSVGDYQKFADIKTRIVNGH